MSSVSSENQRRALYARTVQQMEQRLQPVRDSGAMFSALRWGMEELDRTLATTSAKVKAAIACRAGCAHCCHESVEVQAHEVFFAAEFIQAHFSPADLAAVLELTARHRTQVKGLGSEERARLTLPCPLLRDSRCSIYEGRPEACRAHHTSSAAVCQAHLSDPQIALDKVYIPILRGRMFAVMLGLDEALEAEGFDDRAYEFCSALHEALTNSLCLVLWMRRKSAFPDSCLAEPAITG